MDKSKLYMLRDLIALIERELNWGKGENWSNKDFEELSKLILKKTKKRLSVTTLKRIWGRAERIANPSSATLDILAEYTGFSNWRAFVNTAGLPVRSKVEEKTTLKRVIPFIIGILLLIGILSAFYWPTAQETTMMPEQVIANRNFSFKNRAVSSGLPNSVVFEYDISAAAENATTQIQQSWDSSKRISISKEDSIATCIYYYPGFFQSKLVVDDVIVAEQDVFIPTDGWLGVIERDSIPIYLNKDEIVRNNQLAIAKETIAEYGLDPRTEKVAVSFYQVQDFGALYTNDFDIKLSLKNTMQNGFSSCQWVQIYVLYEGGAVGIPLGKKGCASEMDMMVFGKFINGKKNDLSGFGVDFSEFVDLRCTVNDNIFKILVNNAITYKTPMPDTIEKIRGITIHFEGAGTVSSLEMGTASGSIYTFPK
ncbi:hypothetical protein [Maribacter sp. 2210JD10-5]|uniref:hypothetical protein n=1 Tax=Maribacter sp. 2210JD10-5 TaxID=3386272 RepID=UPI0039BC6E90